MVKSEFDDCFQNGNYDALRPYPVSYTHLMKKNLQMLLGQKKKLHRHGKNIKLMVERSGG